MYGGGVTINKQTAQVIRIAGLVAPVLLLGYGLLVQYGIITSRHYANDTVFFEIMIPFIVLACVQFLYPSKRAYQSAIRLFAYHIVAMLYFVFIAGFSTPLVALWMLLFLASYAYFSRRGLSLSILALVVSLLIDWCIHPDSMILISNTFAFVAVSIVGLTAIAISRVQEVDGVELTRSRAQESLQHDRLLTIVNNLADAVLSTDEDGIIRIYNAASLNLLDTNNSLNGRHIDEILTLHDADKNKIKLSDCLQKARGVVVRDDLTMPLEDETIRLEVTYSPIRGSYKNSKKSSQQDGYILILRDVTKAKSLEEERDEFISVVSHELRTPITIAEGTISNVQVMMGRPNISEKMLQDGIATAHEQVMFLAKMVNDLSTLSRAERGVADTPEVIGVRGLVDDLYNEYSPQAKAKNLHFDLDLGTHLGEVTASSLYLRELLQNFITNSIKYTKEGGVTLAVKRKDDKIIFEVSDTGIGISKSDQAKIFNKFYRSEDYRTRETGGTGLGLYVAVKLAKKLGTKIEMKSRLNHGSTFGFALPSKTKTKDA